MRSLGLSMNTWQKRLEAAVNVAILLAFLLVAAVAGRRLLEKPANGAARDPVVGTTVSLPGTDWKAARGTLVLALSTGCHFCTESAGFYQKLLPFARSQGIQVIAALPQSTDEGQAYLGHLGVAGPTVVQTPLETVEVSGTPTLLLLN